MQQPTPTARLFTSSYPAYTPYHTPVSLPFPFQVELEDPVESVGAALVRQAASKTNDLAGDGTTTACVLSAAFIAEVRRWRGYGDGGEGGKGEMPRGARRGGSEGRNERARRWIGARGASRGGMEG